MSARSSAAWLLPLTGGFAAAVGFREIFHLLPDCPPIFPLPLATPAVPGVILWRERPVAVLDVGRLMRTHAERSLLTTNITTANSAPAVALAAWAPGTSDGPAGTADTSKIGALLLAHAPERIQVDDDQACVIPEDLAGLGGIICSCFEHHGYGKVPIIDLPCLFGQPDVRARPSHEGPPVQSLPPMPHP